MLPLATREALLCEASFRKDLRFRFGDRGMRVCQCLLLPIKIEYMGLVVAMRSWFMSALFVY